MYIETDCTIEHDGIKFTAGGAVVTDSHLVAYPKEGGILQDWHGKEIGRWYEVSSRRAIFFGYESWQGDRYYYMRARVDGKTYSLRGFGAGMVAMGKRIADSNW